VSEPSALIIVQARMTSTRLPGKVLADVGGEPMLELQLRRLERARSAQRIIVATSDDPSDDPIASLAERLGVGVYRGPLHDVLGRFAGAAGDHAGPIVRSTADCPLIDPGIVDEVVGALTSTPGAQYASNIEPTRTFPVGLDVEALPAAVLHELDRKVTDPEEREHVTMHLRRRLDDYIIASVTTPLELDHLRWTVDTAEDLARVRAIVARLADRRHDAPWTEILTVAKALG
jgi:spore coat polysaccharide biosynthesis protein SpsF (cytidylyltransferase family)